MIADLPPTRLSDREHRSDSFTAQFVGVAQDAYSGTNLSLFIMEIASLWRSYQKKPFNQIEISF